MKILFVTRGWPSKDNPMSGNYEAVQARALAKRGVEVTVAYLKKKCVSHIFESRKIMQREDDGITVLSRTVVVAELPDVKTTRYGHLDSWLCQRAFLDLYEHYRKLKGDADVIHAHLIVHAYNCHRVLEKYHIPFVITEHWSGVNSTNVNKNLSRLGDGYKWADKVICVSAALAASLKMQFDIESQVIHNMVSDSFFRVTDLDNKKTSPDVVRFISVGSLVEIKRFDLLINAFKNCQHLAECKLSIIGSGPEEEKLANLIEECGLKNKVFMLGRKKPEEVSELMAASDCFILTSNSETFGIVYIEAMAKGKPVIATICGGPESFVNENNGILIPAEDVDATTKAIDYMVEKHDKYDNASIRQYCHDNFSEEAISEKIIGAYHEAREKHNKTIWKSF